MISSEVPPGWMCPLHCLHNLPRYWLSCGTRVWKNPPESVCGSNSCSRSRTVHGSLCSMSLPWPTPSANRGLLLSFGSSWNTNKNYGLAETYSLQDISATPLAEVILRTPMANIVHHRHVIVWPQFFFVGLTMTLQSQQVLTSLQNRFTLLLARRPQLPPSITLPSGAYKVVH